MEQAEKGQLVSDLHGRFEQASLALLAHAHGLTVAEATRLRRELRAVDGELKVAKNTLARRACRDTKFAPLEQMLRGPSAVVFAYRDPVAVAKVLVRFAEESGKIRIRGGMLDGTRMEPEQVVELAKLPGREALFAQLLALLRAPIVQLLRTVQEPGARVVRLIDRLRAAREQGQC